MKIKRQVNKVQVVLDEEQLFQIAICLSESPVLKNRMLALEIKKEMDKANQEGKK
jgi:hypothetical protein